MDFCEFDSRRPDVWALFEHFTWQLVSAGHVMYSPDTIMARVRWELDVGPENRRARLHDSYAHLYARRFVRLNPDRRAFFTKRRHKRGRRRRDIQGSSGDGEASREDGGER